MNVLKNAIAVPDTPATELIDIDVQHITKLAIRVKNTGSNAFDTFNVLGKFNQNDTVWLLLASVAGDYSTPTGYPVLKASGTPVTLGASAEAWIVFDVTMLHRLKLEAAGNAGATTADLSGIGK